jgi:rhomboid protease GluP
MERRGVTGECTGLAWRPYGAGSSVAICGLLGALAVWMVCRIQSLQARLGAGVLILGALLLTWRHDLHGPPFLAAAVIAGAMLRVARRKQ